MSLTKLYLVWPHTNCQSHSGTAYDMTNGRQFFDAILSSSDCHIIYVGPEEFELAVQGSVSSGDIKQEVLKVVQHASKHNVKISVITGRFHKQPSFKRTDIISMLAEYVDVYYWPTYWMTKSSVEYLVNREFHSPLERNIDTTFVCLNGKPHTHRCSFVDTLARENLVDSNLVTWVIPQWDFGTVHPYQWKYWTERFVSFEDFHMSDGHPQYSCTDPVGYYSTLLDVITETSDSLVFWTEKTARPLATKKPFVILGAQYANRWLEDLGFQLYDEIIDYGFDSLSDIDQRIENIVSQLASLEKRKHEFNDLFKTTYPKLIHNHNRFLEIMKDPQQVPLREVLSPLLDKYDLMMKENLAISSHSKSDDP